LREEETRDDTRIAPARSALRCSGATSPSHPGQVVTPETV